MQNTKLDHFIPKDQCQCYYLEGKNITPQSVTEARLLIGKKVKYLKKSDIDRSGRGYFFPRVGIVTSVQGKNMEIDNDYVYRTDLVEMIIIEIKPDERQED